MGKPYESELAALAETYLWALAVPIDPLASAVAGASGLPVLAVGSGGSFTAAAFASSLHENFTGIPSKAITPLEFISSHFGARNSAVLFASAGGSNSDIVGCFKNAMLREPERCSVLCLRKDSVLARTAAKYHFVDLVTVETPPHHDGFLATNSLLALVVLLSRGYAQGFGTNHGLPASLAELLSHGSESNGWHAEIRRLCRPLWQKDTLLVLFSPALQAAAIDLESKFSEAALGTIHLTDFRNFAHGRHNWLAKRGDSTGVVALVTDQDSELASKTLRLLPNEIPVARMDFPTTTVAASGVAAIVAALYVVGCAGADRKIDPGRPDIPAFGRRIYNLRALQYVPTAMKGGYTTEDVAIARKLRCDVASLLAQPSADLVVWRDAFRNFVRSFDGIHFGGIVFDYDGTLCGYRQRFAGLDKDTAANLARLAKKGTAIGVVTGRGKSVRRDLQRHLPKAIWDHILIGYYNGSVIGRLSDNDVPEANIAPAPIIIELAAAVEQHPVLGSMTSREARHNQMSLQPKKSGMTPYIWRIANQVIQSFPGVRAVISSHSVDLLAPGVSKRQLVDRISDQVSDKKHVLTIGDKGEWPGNDFELLAFPYSLSVDEVSADPSTCWNLAPLGHRGPQATLHYLDALEISRNGIEVDCDSLGRRHRAKGGRK